MIGCPGWCQKTQKTQVPSLGREDPLEKEMAPHSGKSHRQRSLASHKSMGLQRGRHDWVTAQQQKHIMTLRLLIKLQCYETMFVPWHKARKEEDDREWHSSQSNRNATSSSLEVWERLDPQSYYGIWWSPVSLRSTRRGLCPTGRDAPHCSLASYTCSYNTRFPSNRVASLFRASLSTLGPLEISNIIWILLEIPSHFDK